ncbi:M23 family metallopeptidase [Desulfoluna spongiiphila]|uniref:M23 family metallopeptidase n=1 Tax=Desulfoluna spongiiphila TaxID=419481 RepID=UPI0012515511|nr:peptidoglycan DD-metalloendopeptidase family protein [Desulfoluna spongiiphila]VVS92126.1 duplicated hybrid motif [Desulfoluna spongiiphila]
MKYKNIPFLVVFLAALLFTSCDEHDGGASSAVIGAADAPASEPVAEAPALPPEPEETVVKGKVSSGNTAASILKKWLSPSEVYAFAGACTPVYDLTRIRVGNTWQVATLDEEFTRFEYAIDSDSYLEVSRDGEDYTAIVKPIAYDVRMERVTGSIRTSLYGAMTEAGEKPELAVRLGNLMGWEIDFIHDLRVGDTFSVLVEKRYSGNVFKGYGRILAVAFTNQGELHEAFRMEDADGSGEYYAPDGRNLRHVFLKTPVAFTRISSGFTLRRYHPIQKRYKPHYGVDYAAPTGTPIYAIGSGTLKRVATNNSSGNHILITHGNGYESGYLHMSRFARGMRTGRKVKQGDLIGYVGSTGLATGPHLCFRMKIHGKPVDPTKIDTPRAGSIDATQKEAFSRIMAQYRPQLLVPVARVAGDDQKAGRQSTETKG